MRIVLQRVKSASVSIDDVVVGKINQGFLLLVGVGPEDSSDDASYLARKIAGMRIFSDENEFNELLRTEYGLTVETGEFGADMQVSLVNDGPVTIILDTKNQ